MLTNNYLNLSYIKNLSAGNNLFVIRMLQTFCNNVPNGITDLLKNAEAGNWEEVRQAAHKMKTMFRYVGLDNVAEDLERIEFGSMEMSESQRSNILTRVDAASKRAVSAAQDIILTTPV